MRKSLRATTAALALSATAAIGTPIASAAPSVPWTDPSAVGYLGFCDAHNHQIRSGSVFSFPFVAKAVSSVAAPAGYGAPGGHATLYAFQPIQHVDPSNWSGKQMTGTSRFTNANAPMAAGLPADPSLVNFSDAYPLYWNGYAQLRFYYTAVGLPEFVQTYPAAVVQVTGHTWTQVGGGSVNCSAGSVTSGEHDLHIATHAQTAPSAAADSAAAGNSSGSNAPGGSSSSGAGGSGAPSTGATSGAASSSKTGGSSNGGLIVGVLLAVAAASAGAVYYVRRRIGRSA
jgi:hypothetical protein